MYITEEEKKGIKEFYRERRNKLKMTPRQMHCIHRTMPWLNKSDTVLDIGCGAGFITTMLSFFVKKIVGADWVIGPVTKFWAGFPVDFIEVDVLQGLPVANNDVVTAFDLIEHIHPKDRQLWVKNIKASLKKGGLLIINTAEQTGTDQPIDIPLPLEEQIKFFKDNDFKLLNMDWYESTPTEDYIFTVYRND